MANSKSKQPAGPGTGKARSQPTQAQKRLAAQRAMAAASGARAAKRRRLLTVLSPVGVVVLIAVIFVGVKLASGSDKPKSGAQASAAHSSVIAAVTGVPPAVLDEVGKGSIETAPKALTGAALTADGKPRVLFVGAEWCPYCAAERWPLVVALSRFGTLTGLGQVSSSPSDVDPNTATLTFHGASYTSDYLALTAKEIFSNQVKGNSYAPLDTLSAADRQIYDANGGGFPFIDIGGKYLFSATYDPATLTGKTQAQIVAALSDPSSAIAKAVDGSANVITAAICATTADKPAGVCSSQGVMAAAAVLPGSG